MVSLPVVESVLPQKEEKSYLVSTYGDFYVRVMVFGACVVHPPPYAPFPRDSSHCINTNALSFSTLLSANSRYSSTYTGLRFTLPPPRPILPSYIIREDSGLTPHPPRGLQNLCDGIGLRGGSSEGRRTRRESKPSTAAKPQYGAGRPHTESRRGVVGYRGRLHGTRGVRASGVPLWGSQDMGRHVPCISGAC